MPESVSLTAVFHARARCTDSKIYFTTAEDDILLSKDDKGISDIEKKHGTRIVAQRIMFLEG